MMLFGSNPKELMKAFAVYGAAAPAGGTAGVFLGGVITEWISLAVGLLRQHPDRARRAGRDPRACCPPPPARRGSIDIGGALDRHRRPRADRLRHRPRARGGLGLGRDARSRSPAGSRLLAAFVAIQAARREPLMRLGILRTPNLAAANLAQVLLGAAWIPMWFFLNLYLQQVLGYGAFEGGAALLPMTVAIMLLMVVVAPGRDRALRAQDADRARHAAARRRHGGPVARATRRLASSSTCCPRR